MTDTAYALVSIYYDECEVVAVFTGEDSEKRAKAACPAYTRGGQGPRVVSCTLNPDPQAVPDGFTAFLVRRYSNTGAMLTFPEMPVNVSATVTENVHKGSICSVDVTVLARDDEHAIDQATKAFSAYDEERP
jgi:hypothetical protein